MTYHFSEAREEIKKGIKSKEVSESEKQRESERERLLPIDLLRSLNEGKKTN